jgi:hypothetical protein
MDDMPWDAATYDADRELTGYVWHNYFHLLSPFEFTVWKAVAWQQKGAPSNGNVARVLRKRFEEARSDPQVAAAIDDYDLFRQQARDRILAEHADKVTINRCSRCQRIVATPLARQCLWCGLDWHNPKT